MARTRTTKKLAQRIDLNYFKRPTPLKRAKLWLSILLPLLALLWIGERTLTKDSSVYSSGRMSEPHAVLEKECAACHLPQAGAFSAKATDSACLACHDAPQHHPVRNVIGRVEVGCAACHTEHRGRINISTASNQACAECHSDLSAHADFHVVVTMSVPTKDAAIQSPAVGNASPKANYDLTWYATRIASLEDGHPEFAALRNGTKDPESIKLNHAIHMKPIRRGPNGPIVQLECGDCHRPAAVPGPSTYSDTNYVGAKTTYIESHTSVRFARDMLSPPHPPTSRELMTPVKFANACAGCHLLTFDKRFDFGVPHDSPYVVRSFISKTFQEYIAAHPAELRVARDPGRNLTGKPMPPEFRTLTPAQWVEERTSDAEELLWRKTCSQCHSLSFRYEGQPEKMPQTPPWLRTSNDTRAILRILPEIGLSFTTRIWLPHAKFDHDAHRGFSCVSCHEKALTSTESSDVLVPGIANCKTCHAPGPDHSESRCFECHTYHDWSQRKEVTPTFTLPALRHGAK